MSSEAEQKRRPPPIQIPEHRVIPGPNAFALAAKAKQQAEKGKEDASFHTPKASPLENPEHLEPTTQIRRGGSHHGSVATNFGQIIDAARSSPRKSGQSSSTNSRHGSTARSRHSNRSHQSAASSQREHVEGESNKKKFVPSARQEIEAKSEKKLFRMMGQQPDTPTEATHPIVHVGHFKKPEEVKSPKKKLFGMTIPTFRSSASTTPAPADLAPKAAKVLGAGTGTDSVTNTPTKRRDQPSRPPPQQVRSDTSRSLPAKLYNQQNQSRRQNHQPANVPAHTRTPIRKPSSPKRGTPRKDTSHPALQESLSTSTLSIPPTPPQKDTPPDQGKLVGWALSQLTQEVTEDDGTDEDSTLRMPDFFANAQPVPSKGGDSVKKRLPTTTVEHARIVKAQRIPSDEAHLENDDVCELEGDYNYASDVKGDAPEMQEQYTGWWHEEGLKRYTNDFKDPKLQEVIKASQGFEGPENGSTSKLSTVTEESQRSNKGPPLPPTFYSPSTYSLSLFPDSRPSENTDPNRLVFTLPPNSQSSHSSMRKDPSSISIDMVFQGTASEIDPASNTGKLIHSATEKSEAQETITPSGLKDRVMQELNSGKQAEAHERPSAGYPNLQPDQSSSKLTDILSGVSPTRSGYHNEFYPSNASAVPSPLHAMPSHQMIHTGIMPPHTPLSPPSLTGTLPDGSNILTHFFMCNQHIDVLGRTIWDVVDSSKRQTLEEVEQKQKETVAIMEERFKEIKVQAESMRDRVGHACESISESCQSVNSKMDQLMDFIKAEVVEPLAKANRKNREMESDIKQLKLSVQELKKMVETKLMTPNSQPNSANPTQSCFPSNLPTHRSQPSLVGYPGAASDIGHGNTPRVPSIHESRNDNRFRYAGNHGYNGHGNQWARPPTSAGRENKDEGNPFNSPSLYQYGSYGGGYMGYGGFYPGGPNEHAFSYHSANPNQSK